ncbi:Gp49 family protein [Bradyrhizobium sp. Pa8]|uniref:Gp49 family protein n=1 Tax=Bradyrhizobium sp. Pa8 TaxID=3386552 RepID=UPI00403F1424
MDSLKVTDAASEAVAVAPRVKLSDIEAAIIRRYDVRGCDAVGEALVITGNGKPGNPLGLLSLCILEMRNGFTIVGKSARASPENFDAELGKQYAYEDAVRQLWPLMGFALRDRLAAPEWPGDRR